MSRKTPSIKTYCSELHRPGVLKDKHDAANDCVYFGSELAHFAEINIFQLKIAVFKNSRLSVFLF